MTLFGTLIEVVAALEAAEIPYVVGGSVASSTWGKQRATQDIDIAVFLRVDQVQKLRANLPEHYLMETGELEDYARSARDFQCGQILHMEHVDRVDLFVLEDSEFNRSRLSRAIEARLLPDVVVRVSSPEDIIITKLRWYELGRGISDRQWNDLVLVIETQGDDLDWTYLEKWAAHFGLAELLDEAKAEAIQP